MRLRLFHKLLSPLVLVSIALAVSGCSNLPFIQQNKAHSRIFVGDFATAWSAALESVSAATDVIQNRDLGTIETGWFKNTDSRNFFEAFGPEDHFNRARYRLYVYVREGKKSEKQAVVVRVQLEQQVEKSPFSGWETIESSGLMEATYLYRIGRLIALQQYAEKKDSEKSRNFDTAL
jgi:hypothetical protein